MKPIKKPEEELAQLQYHGDNGVTQDCLNAILRLINYGDFITHAKLLSNERRHGFILYTQEGEVIAIKRGFASGYTGEGPRGLAKALSLLERHGADIREYELESDVMQRFDFGCLTVADYDSIDHTKLIYPQNWYDYVLGHTDLLQNHNEKLNNLFPEAIPFGIIDSRLTDIAISFRNSPVSMLRQAYCRLENTVRDRIGLKGLSSTGLFKKAFQGNESYLTWNVDTTNEKESRAQIFINFFGAFRNRISHQEIQLTHRECVREFLLINQLFILESQAVENPQQQDNGSSE